MRKSLVLVPFSLLAIAAAVAFADPSENPAAAPGATTTSPTTPYGTDNHATSGEPTDLNRPTDRTRSTQSSRRRSTTTTRKYTPPAGADSSSPGNPATVNPPPVGAPAGTTGVPSGAAAH